MAGEASLLGLPAELKGAVLEYVSGLLVVKQGIGSLQRRLTNT